MVWYEEDEDFNRFCIFSAKIGVMFDFSLDSELIGMGVCET
jgi:hypothetical protein